MLDLVNILTAGGYFMALVASVAAIQKLQGTKPGVAHTIALIGILFGSLAGFAFEILSWPQGLVFVSQDIKHFVRVERTISAILFFALVIKWIDTARRRVSRNVEPASSGA